MKWGNVAIAFFLLLLLGSVWTYFFFPSTDPTDFTIKPQNGNFSLGVLESANSQFYENMRYSDSKISYRISEDCTLKKIEDMELAFDWLEEETVLQFYPVESGEEIFVTCDEKEKIEGDYFIAGEGGPTNITKAGEFNVILNGQILLIKDSPCATPNIALHELLHTLGLDHSKNKENIMYNITDCDQELGDDIPRLINELYSIKALPDLKLEEVVPIVHGKYLDVNISMRNGGLSYAGPSTLEIYADSNLIEEMDIEEMDIGFGMRVVLQNLKTKDNNVEELKFVLTSTYEELDKENNEIVFVVKN